MEAGSIAEWVAAAAALAAVVAAVVAGGYAKKAYDLEREREDKVQTSRRRSQASRISAWPAYRKADQCYGVMIANASDALVYSASVTTRSQSFGHGTTVLRVLPPGLYFAPKPWESRREFPEPVVDEGAFRPVMSTDKYEAELEFTDAKGVQWHRPHGLPLSERTG